MASFKIDPSELYALAAELDQASRQIAAALDTLTRKTKTLMSQWTGEAADSFLTAETDWNASMERINKILASASETASNNATTYENAESRVARMWAQ